MIDIDAGESLLQAAAILLRHSRRQPMLFRVGLRQGHGPRMLLQASDVDRVQLGVALGVRIVVADSGGHLRVAVGSLAAELVLDHLI